MDKKDVLLSVKDLEVKFRVRGRILTAIRNISLDIYEGESIAIVGESGSGKSVFTKTFAGMLDSNGFVSEGNLIFNDDVLSDTVVKLTSGALRQIDRIEKKLNEYSHYEYGSETYKKIVELEAEKDSKTHLSDEDSAKVRAEIKELVAKKTDLFNLKQTFDSKEKEKIKKTAAEIAELEKQIKAKEAESKSRSAELKKAAAADTEYLNKYNEKHASLKAKHEEEIKKELTPETIKRNKIIAKEIYLSVGRYSLNKRLRMISKLLAAFKKAFMLGVDVDDDNERNAVFDTVIFRVKYLDETPEKLHGTCVINLAKIKDIRDWTQIRGSRIATVFQDPMTSLNPIITIGKQITSIILKHQDCSEAEARHRALDLMRKVGIPNAEARFDDYPFQYSGGMRQRIVIAIALSCQPKILICDEPTTALDVTIQAQILQLIKDLQKEFGYTIVFITHDLGVVANVADRVAVLYAGQIVEVGTVEEVFYDPRHPYTWALLSSLPQLAQKNTKLYSITGTPPSLYNKITGDSFAPRNPYCLKVDTLFEPPMFKVTDTHYAKTWLLDPRSPKIEKPEGIQDIHEKLMKAFNI
ncbi:MAG: ATP-binding cassette domain-containing protein [Ruminococcaceae bacterium]|nr:ATP-binding cassette domain-containing protein [Oscillospiraceae bacterium]